MLPRDPSKILALLLLSLISAIPYSGTLAADGEIIETKVYQDSSGVAREEYAFRAPIKGVPNQVLRMYCANVKVRLYWDVFREQAKGTHRYSANLRRMARFAKHVYKDIRRVDKPFNATQLSVVDEYFGVKEDADDRLANDNAGDDDDDDDDNNNKSMILSKQQTSSNQVPCQSKKSRLRSLTKLFNRSKSTRACHDKKDKPVDEREDEEASLDKSIDRFKELDSVQMDPVKKVKAFFKEYAPKVGLGIYTRWATMWWLMMSCLFAKYYLWDPALDEFQKLQRNLIMYPDIQLVKLQDLNCKPVRFFQRILDVCGILNPIMNYDFGQLSLDKMTRFKSDIVKEM